jgi:hypothetical protein
VFLLQEDSFIALGAKHDEEELQIWEGYLTGYRAPSLVNPSKLQNLKTRQVEDQRIIHFSIPTDNLEVKIGLSKNIRI